jgi:hypothetical protein
MNPISQIAIGALFGELKHQWLMPVSHDHVIEGFFLKFFPAVRYQVFFLTQKGRMWILAISRTFRPFFGQTERKIGVQSREKPLGPGSMKNFAHPLEAVIARAQSVAMPK